MHHAAELYSGYATILLNDSQLNIIATCLCFTKIKIKIKIKTKTKTQPQSSLSKTPETNAFFATHKNYPFTINIYKTNTRCTTGIVCGGADPIIK